MVREGTSRSCDSCSSCEAELTFSPPPRAQVAALLDRLSGTVSPSFFFQNLWLVLITAPHSRIPALNYLARRLPRDESGTGSEDALDAIVGQDVGLMVRGFAAALEDDKILVQRGILDLLIGTLRIDSASFRRCVSSPLSLT